MYSVIRAMCDEFRASVEEKVSQYKLENDVKESMVNLIVYTFSDTLNIKSFFLDRLFNEIHSHVEVEGSVKVEESVKSIIDASVDYLNIIFKLHPFDTAPLKRIEHDMEDVLYKFLKEKIGKGALVKDKYHEFIEAMRKSYNRGVILRVIRKRVQYSIEAREELSSLLEYLTFSGRSYLEEDELERIQSALNFRLNKLKNYSFDYFVMNFFMQRSDIIPMSDKYDAVRYSYPDPMIRELKNLLLTLDASEREEKDIQEDAKEIIHKQFSRIESLQKSIDKLKKT